MAENPKLSSSGENFSEQKYETLLFKKIHVYYLRFNLSRKNPVVLEYVKMNSVSFKRYVTSSSEVHCLLFVLCLLRSISYASWI